MTDYKIAKAIKNWVEYSFWWILHPKFIEYIVVWWGWGWLAWNGNNWWGWWGAVCTWYKLLSDNNYCVVVWCWWTGNITKTWEEATDWTASCFWDIIIANWWCKWNWFTWWTSWSWCSWWTNTSWCWCYWGWWWWWASTAAASDTKATEWWYWICWYWWWWWWWYPCSFNITSWHDWWWNWLYWWTSWWDATNYWWWGWGGWCVAYAYDIFPRWWNWCQWLIKVCYKTDWSCWFSCATWWTVTTDWDYTVHTFTSDWTFCIVS